MIAGVNKYKSRFYEQSLTTERFKMKFTSKGKKIDKKKKKSTGQYKTNFLGSDSRHYFPNRERKSD